MNDSTVHDIEEFLSDVVTADMPVVFGSYARGEAYSASDFDLLLIDDRYNGWTVYDTDFPVRWEWPDEFPDLHLVCCSHDEFRERYCGNEDMVCSICDEGYCPTDVFAFLDYYENIEC